MSKFKIGDYIKWTFNGGQWRIDKVIGLKGTSCDLEYIESNYYKGKDRFRIRIRPESPVVLCNGYNSPLWKVLNE